MDECTGTATKYNDGVSMHCSEHGQICLTFGLDEEQLIRVWAHHTGRFHERFNEIRFEEGLWN
jgi:hypothetical protein